MPVRVTMVFTSTTTPGAEALRARHARWTERHYATSATIAEAKLLASTGDAAVPGSGLFDRRASLLGTGCRLDSAKFQLWSEAGGLREMPIGGVEEVKVGKLGFALDVMDYPQQGILFTMELAGGHSTRPKFIIRGVPDRQVNSGELAFVGDYGTRVANFLAALAGNYGTFVDDRAGAANTGSRMSDVAPDGWVTGVGRIDFLAVGDPVRVTRTVNSDGRKVGGFFYVQIVDAILGRVKLAGWDLGETTGGHIRRFRRAFAVYAATGSQYERQATRKVGSPKSYRGANRRRR